MAVDWISFLQVPQGAESLPDEGSSFGRISSEKLTISFLQAKRVSKADRAKTNRHGVHLLCYMTTQVTWLPKLPGCLGYPCGLP
jgi:hypothetical protein